MRFKKSDADVPQQDMTPLIDVVFQLLIFFMLVTNFEQTQADERVKLPRDKLAQPPKVARDKDLVINIGYFRDESGRVITHNGDRGPFVFFDGEAYPVPQFGQRLGIERQLQKNEDVDPKEITVVIRADREVPTGMIQELMKVAQELEYVKFALAATQQQVE